MNESMKDWFIFKLPVLYWSMNKISLVLPFLLLSLAHVLAVCHKSHFSVLIHPDFTLWKPDLLFSLASAFLPHCPSSSSQMLSERKPQIFFLFFSPTGRILGERKDFLFLYTFRSYDFINLKKKHEFINVTPCASY